MKILANDGISAVGVKNLEENGFEVSTTNVPQDQLIETINKEKYTVILVRSATKVRKDIIDSCPSLKIIGRGGVGMDNIDVEYARSQGLSVINTPGASSQSVAELVMGHFFSLARGLHDSHRLMPQVGTTEFKSLKKKYGKGKELRGNKLGIIGLGRIGRALGSYAIGVGMEVVAFDKFQNDAPIVVPVGNYGKIDVRIPFVGFDELLNTCDFISIHVPKQEDGSAVITKNEFEKMKDGVILANAARGGVIDEKDLLEYLANGKVRGAALDVFDNEPTPNGDLMINENISHSPHIGAATLEAQDRIGVELADQIIEILKNDNK